jgi:hypothetical protein
MALKRLSDKTVKMATPPPTNSKIPVIPIDEEDLLKRYVKADQQKKAAEAEMKELGDEIRAIGLDEIFTRSCKHPMEPTTTVRLQDRSQEIVRVEFINSYKEVAALPKLEKLFKSEKLDINNFIQESVKAKFDDSVFYDDEGEFDAEIYEEIREALQSVVDSRPGMENPLQTSKIIKPKDSFHAERFAAFPHPEQQADLFDAAPNTVRIIPNGNDKK